MIGPKSAWVRKCSGTENGQRNKNFSYQVPESLHLFWLILGVHSALTSDCSKHHHLDHTELFGPILSAVPFIHLPHEQNFNGVIQTRIKFFVFQRINISSKTGQDHSILIYSYVCPKKQITFFPLSHPLYLCGWAAAQNNLTLASKFHLLAAKCWYKR